MGMLVGLLFRAIVEFEKLEVTQVSRFSGDEKEFRLLRLCLVIDSAISGLHEVVQRAKTAENG
jgi:hypothetical protein